MVAEMEGCGRISIRHLLKAAAKSRELRIKA